MLISEILLEKVDIQDPLFKKWFNGSKVVDKKGKELKKITIPAGFLLSVKNGDAVKPNSMICEQMKQTCEPVK